VSAQTRQLQLQGKTGSRLWSEPIRHPTCGQARVALVILCPIHREKNQVLKRMSTLPKFSQGVCGGVIPDWGTPGPCDTVQVCGCPEASWTLSCGNPTPLHTGTICPAQSWDPLLETAAGLHPERISELLFWRG
jgi:hypothetical protein